MTKQDHPSDEEINALYSQRKSQHLAPLSIKRQILSEQQNNQGIEYIFKRISFVAVAASTLILMGLLIIQQSDRVSSEVDFQLVQMHTLESSPESLSDNINSRYAKHYRDYLAQQQTYSAHHKTKAVLHLADDGWQLKSCDRQSLQLSNDLIAALNNIEKIDAQIANGNTVEIAFDQTGIVLGITKVPKTLEC